MYTIVGIERLDYISKRTKRHVQGTKLYLTFEDVNIEGYGVLEAYCKNDVDTSFVQVGDNVDLLYDRFGNVAAVGVQTTVQ